MNLKIPLILILCGILGILVNHFVIDWESVTISKANKFFDELVEAQKEDLTNWSSNTSSNPNFRKRSFCGDSLVRWNDNYGWFDFAIENELGIVEDPNGVFLVQRLEQNKSCYSISVFPILNRYSITNNYLKTSRNPLLLESITCVSNSSGVTRYRDHFYYEIERAPSKKLDAALSVLVVLGGLLLMWIGLSWNFLYSIVGVIAVRSVMLYFGLSESLVRFPLFDPLNYTWSFWNPTLGDLFINCLLVFLIALKWSRKYRSDENWPNEKALYPITAITQILNVSIFWILWRILTNSQISLDVGQTIEFDYLRVFSYLCVILLIGTAFLCTFRLVAFIRNSKPGIRFYLLLFISTFAFLFVSFTSVLVALIFSAAITITSRLDWGSKLKEFKYENLQFALLISVIASGILSYSVYKFYEKSELDAKMKFANQLLIRKDVLGEYYLNQMMEEMNSEAESGEVGEQLLNPYFDKYEVKIIDSLDSSYTQYRLMMTKDRISDYDAIYLIDIGTDFTYLCDLGSSIISLELKKRVPTSVFPALLTDNKYDIPTDNFDYAVFKDDHVLFQRSKFGQGDWPDAEGFNSEALYDEGIEKNGQHYYGVKTTDNRIILIISKKYSLEMQLSNFSFFFLISLFFLGAIVLISSINFENARLNFTGKIQLYLGLAFIIPLFTAGFALLNSLNSSYREEINRSYLKRSLYISELLSDDVSDNVGEISSAALARARDYIQADLSLYDADGKLVSTSQREIFDLGLQSPNVNPIVFSELVEKENLSLIADETIGELEYKVSYATINNDDNEIAGFIAMPFFDSRNHLKRQQLEVFGSLIDIFGLIFIIAILFGSMILNNLMQPLRMVAEKISHITLQEENKPIVYDSSDEIGSLVRDYNSMLVKLEQSKSALARSQKEVAWKEIAKQVAHEIKNPLTPMQLKIQQLLRKHEEGSKDHETLSSLLIQVDTMSQIASSFSAFAEMPVPDNTTLDFSRLLHQVIGLYHTDDVNINSEIEDELFIHADKDIFQRIINNIILNAIQSVENKRANILVKLSSKVDKCELMVQDNGKGIKEELKDKIFLNYFSTKSSGSGIGLALAKKGIENAGGNIWFESSENEGTSFFITMPLVAG